MVLKIRCCFCNSEHQSISSNLSFSRIHNIASCHDRIPMLKADWVSSKWNCQAHSVRTTSFLPLEIHVFKKKLEAMAKNKFGSPDSTTLVKIGIGRSCLMSLNLDLYLWWPASTIYYCSNLIRPFCIHGVRKSQRCTNTHASVTW